MAITHSGRFQAQVAQVTQAGISKGEGYQIAILVALFVCVHEFVD
jgi:hypothetical protein